MVKFAVGQPATRLEDRRLLTGGGQYTDDLTAENAARAYVLRAPYAHAELGTIDTAGAGRAPGVLAVLTGADVAAAGLGDIPCLVEAPNRDGTPRHDTPRPILARGRVRHVGEPVAVVIAETLAQAKDAAELIAVEYDELPAVTDTRGATRPGQPQVWDHVADNICFDWASGDPAAVAAAFAAADRIVTLELTNNRVVVNSMEPRAALAVYDPASDRSTLFLPTQGPHFLKAQLAETVLKIAPEKLRLRTTDVGGGFGMKLFLYPEPCLAVWASRRLKRPVRWTAERTESFLSDAQGRDNVSTAELALDADGHFLGLKVTTWAGLGAYLSNFGPFVVTQAGTNMLAGVYKTPAISVNVKGVLTNTVPTDAYRGAGRPEAAYLIERIVDKAGRETGLGPAEIRRRNFVTPADMPFTTAMGDVYDSGEFAAILAEAMARADWDGVEARRAEARSRGKLLGIGLATYIERCGGGAPEVADVRFTAADKIEIAIGTQDNGQGHRTAYTQILAGRLGIGPERVTVIQGDTDRTPPGFTGGSRSVPVGGAAVLGAADRIIEKGLLVAANLLETAAVDLEYRDGAFRVAGTDRTLELFAVAKAARDAAHLPAGIEPGLDNAYTRTPEAPTFPNGCHIVELEVDEATGETAIVRYTVVDDFGGAINPLTLFGQIHGGIAQGVGQALTEHTVYDDDTGQLLSGSLMDYCLPRAHDLPALDITLHNVPCTTNPLGIKGAGEAGAVGAPPAVINALVDALTAAGRGAAADRIDMPATPLALWQAFN